MEVKLVIALVLATIASCVIAEKARYDNYRVYDILIETQEQLQLMQQIENYPDGVS
jgi:hypothetical protein